MLSFQPIDENSVKILDPFFLHQDHRICDYTHGTACMWADYFQAEYTVFENVLIIKSVLKNGTTAFTMPIGPGSIEDALGAIDAWCEKQGLPVAYEPVPESCLPVLRARYGSAMQETTKLDWADYLYDKNDLIYLKGRRYNTQRNHINKFIKTYGGYEYHTITAENLDQVRTFFRDFMDHAAVKSEQSEEEMRMTMKVLDHYFRLCQVGGFISVGGQIVAFSVGEVVGDTLFVHIEKALREFPGAYPVINMEFVKHNDSETIRFVNREEDMGDEGLRQAKSRYGPVEMLKKYSVLIAQ